MLVVFEWGEGELRGDILRGYNTPPFLRTLAAVVNKRKNLWKNTDKIVISFCVEAIFIYDWVHPEWGDENTALAEQKKRRKVWGRGRVFWRGGLYKVGEGGISVIFFSRQWYITHTYCYNTIIRMTIKAVTNTFFRIETAFFEERHDLCVF
jgi:hypothetical protein